MKGSTMTGIPATPAPTTYPGTSGLTIMGFPGFTGYPDIVYCQSPDGSHIHPRSALSFAAEYDDTVITLGHPMPGREEEYINAVVELITGPTILIGLSTGGQLAEKIFQAAARAGKLRYLYLVLGSTPDTAATLRPSLARLVPTLARIPNRLGVPLVRYALFPLFIHVGAYCRLLMTRRESIIALLWKSVRRSVWMFDAIRFLNESPGFGPDRITEPRVATLNLRRPRRDKVINIAGAVEAARRAYPNLVEFTYDGTEHGVYEIDAAEVSTALRQIRTHAAPLLGIPV
jgi:hypothetical protein